VSILDTAPALHIHDSLVAWQPMALLFLLLEIILLAGYGWLLLEAVQQICIVKNRMPIENSLNDAECKIDVQA
jgi:hypothetical protein